MLKTIVEQSKTLTTVEKLRLCAELLEIVDVIQQSADINDELADGILSCYNPDAPSASYALFYALEDLSSELDELASAHEDLEIRLTTN